MKIATVYHHPENVEAEYIYIENMDDLTEYQEFLNGKLEDTMVRLLKTKTNPERWDHHCNADNHGDTVMLHSIIRSKTFSGDNPLLNAPHLAQQKIDGMTKALIRGETVLINKKGGWCTPCSIIEVLDYEEYRQFEDESKDIYYHIGNPTKAINLENDPDLEQRTKDYFKEINDTDPSYIVNLRQFSKDDLVDIFNQFHENGGDHVFVYTTGLDTDQMCEYCDAIIESNVQKVVFEFNAGYSEEHHNIVEYLQHYGINVTVEEF